MICTHVCRPVSKGVWQGPWSGEEQKEEGWSSLRSGRGQVQGQRG